MTVSKTATSISKPIFFPMADTPFASWLRRASHSPTDALTGEEDQRAVSRWTTLLRTSSSRLPRSKATSCTWHFGRRIASSPISRAEYSIDADDWQTAEPVGQISDYKIENYDLTVPLSDASHWNTEGRAGRRAHHRGSRLRPLRQCGSRQDGDQGGACGFLALSYRWPGT